MLDALSPLVSLVTVLLALSVASERLVELVKGFFPPLNGQDPDPNLEVKRQLKIHWMSVLASGVVVVLSQGYIKDTLHLTAISEWQDVVLALLASGGSSVWNSILTYLLSIKNIKRQDDVAGESQLRVQGIANDNLAAGLPRRMPSL